MQQYQMISASGRVTRSLVSVAIATAALVACGTAGEPGSEDLGHAVLSIAEVPPQTHCIEVTVANESRSTERFFDVLPGQSSILHLNALPTGNVTFNGAAYTEDCAQVIATTAPTWQTEPTPASLLPGVQTSVTLTFLPNGLAEVTADFIDEGSGCGSGEVLCNGACVDVQTDPDHCGACNNVCAAPQQCVAGQCVAASQFSASFTEFQPSPVNVCQDWNQFRMSLSGNYSSVQLEGSLSPVPVVCNAPSRANDICQAIRTGQVLNTSCDGNQWTVRQCAGGVAVAVNAGDACSCAASSALRPCSPSPDWGGVNTPVCGGPSQTITIRCE